MNIIYPNDNMKQKIACWAEWDTLDETCKKQISNLASLPFKFQHIAIMPDAHGGYGMPIGGVLATKGVVIPNAVGVN